MAEKKIETAQDLSVVEPLQQEFEREFLLAIPVYLRDRRQEEFCVLIAKGNTAVNAYKKAYPNNKSSDKTITEAASRLARKEKIRKRIHQLRAKILAKEGVSIKFIITNLKDLAVDDRDKCSSGRAKALELLGKYKGLYSEREIGIQSSGNITVVLPSRAKDI